MSTEREHAHARKRDDDHLDHDDRSIGHRNQSAMLHAPEHPVTSGLVARKADRDGNGVEHGAGAAIATAAGSSGTSLPSTIMRKFESSLGADLSSVRVHTGAESQSAASAVGAKAYTMGQDIHFGAGHYDPSSSPGEHLLAHEVAHTVQQAGGATKRQNKLEVSTPFDPAEHEADSAADAMVSGRSFAVTSGSGIQRESWGDAPATEAHSTVSPSYQFTIPFPESKAFPVGGVAKLQFAGSISGSVTKAEKEEDGGKAEANKAEVKVGPTIDTKEGLGVQEQIELTKVKLGDFGSWSLTREPAIEIIANKEKVEVAVSGILKFTNSGATWLHVGGDLSARVFEVKYDEFKKNMLKGLEGPGLVGTLTVSGERTFGDVKMAITSSASATLSPDWTELAKRAVRQLVERGLMDASEAAALGVAAGEGTAEATGEAVAADGAATTEAATAATGAGETASTGIILDVSAIALEAAPLLLVSGVALITALANEQEGKNQLAAQAGRDAGRELCTEVEHYVSGYWAVLDGSDSATGRGAEDANKKVEAYIAATGKDRQAACFDLLYEKNPQQMRQELRQRLRDRLFDDAFQAFKDNPDWKAKEGAVEHMGDTLGGDWGMEDVFKSNLRDYLYVYEEG